MAKKSFDPGKFVSENPVVSLIFIGGIGYLGYAIYSGIKKGQDEAIEKSTGNPFNYTAFIEKTNKIAQLKKQKIAVISADERLTQAKKLYNTWNTFGFDYPDEAIVIINNFPSKYDFAQTLITYRDKYGSDYQADIKDKYSEDNYNRVMESAKDMKIDYRKL